MTPQPRLLRREAVPTAAIGAVIGQLEPGFLVDLDQSLGDWLALI
jgi:hypothetical protein